MHYKLTNEALININTLYKINVDHHHHHIRFYLHNCITKFPKYFFAMIFLHQTVFISFLVTVFFRLVFPTRSLSHGLAALAPGPGGDARHTEGGRGSGGRRTEDQTRTAGGPSRAANADAGRRMGVSENHSDITGQNCAREGVVLLL